MYRRPYSLTLPRSHLCNLLISGVFGQARPQSKKTPGLPWILLISFLSIFTLLSEASAPTQLPPRQTVLILNEVNATYPLTNVLTVELVKGVQDTARRRVEFYSEYLDLLSLPEGPSLPEFRDWLFRKYGRQGVDVVVAVGPETIKFVTKNARTLFSKTPIVIFGSSADQAGFPNLDSRFTGTWQAREPGKTIEVALRLFPNTRHVFVVGGSSVYDQVVMAATKVFFGSFRTETEITYLADMEMEKVLGRLRNLPANSIVLYVSFFQDSLGNKFVNATSALPLVASAADAPVFGMSDTYLGHGIVGGDVMSFQEQGKVTARIVSELLDGKNPQDIPIETLPSVYMFDWNELKRWHIPESRLPLESVVLFREPSLWERTKWLWYTTFLIVLGLLILVAYLGYSRKQMRLARERQRQLSDMLINAEGKEQRRIASELHDDFSQRMALIALGLENVEGEVPNSFQDAHSRLRQLANSTSELSSDMHSLSHRLHSSTLESLGLFSAVAALCKEYTDKQGIEVTFASNESTKRVPPDIALYIYRILQEGLRNVKKHSGAQEAEVELQVTDDCLDLIVRDNGWGFDLNILQKNEGIGIRTIEERTLSLGGKFTIHSQPAKGTTIEVRVPLRHELKQAKASGK
jgi:signal transduction histidine kinase